MTDFFGGILDSLRGTGDDVSGFFNSAIGQAVAKGISGGFGKEKEGRGPNLDDGFYSGNARFSPTSDNTAPAKSEDFTQIELEWYRRLSRIAGLNPLVESTRVKLGK